MGWRTPACWGHSQGLSQPCCAIRQDDCNVLMQERWTNPDVNFVRYHLMDVRFLDVLWQQGLRMVSLTRMGDGQRGILTVNP